MQLLSSRILMSLGMIVFVGALAAGATGAFFSDTETSTGNTFAAGALDLTIDNSSYGFDWNGIGGTTTPTGVWGPNPSNSWQLGDLNNCGDGNDPCLFFSFGDLKPGDYGEDTISLHVQNAAYACMAFDLTGTPENLVNEPEASFPDTTVGADQGELQNYLSFLFWYDDGDNVFESGETVIPALSGLPGSAFTGQWLAIADSGSGTPLVPGVTNYIGKGWCFGAMAQTPATPAANPNGPTPGNTGFTCSGAGNHNVAQTDGIVVDVAFHAVQSRNNGQFLCSGLPPVGGPVVDPAINQSDLATILSEVVNDPTKWFFYNDTNDTIMTIDQFSGTSGQNHMELVAGEEGAKMTLDTGVDPRYNIATAQFSDVLGTISSLKFRVYDATADSDTPFLHFNVDFATTTITGGFQNRLVMVPGAGGNAALPAATWTTVDGQGTAMWTWSGLAKGPDKLAATGDDNTWPDGSVAVYRTWNDIVAAFPNAKLLSPGSFFGVRTGQPGPAGATNFVSSIEFDGTVYDFEI